jgi:hypothetical protein
MPNNVEAVAEEQALTSGSAVEEPKRIAVDDESSIEATRAEPASTQATESSMTTDRIEPAYPELPSMKRNTATGEGEPTSRSSSSSSGADEEATSVPHELIIQRTTRTEQPSAPTGVSEQQHPRDEEPHAPLEVSQQALSQHSLPSEEEEEALMTRIAEANSTIKPSTSNKLPSKTSQQQTTSEDVDYEEPIPSNSSTTEKAEPKSQYCQELSSPLRSTAITPRRKNIDPTNPLFSEKREICSETSSLTTTCSTSCDDEKLGSSVAAHDKLAITASTTIGTVATVTSSYSSSSSYSAGTTTSSSETTTTTSCSVCSLTSASITTTTRQSLLQPLQRRQFVSPFRFITKHGKYHCQICDCCCGSTVESAEAHESGDKHWAKLAQSVSVVDVITPHTWYCHVCRKHLVGYIYENPYATFAKHVHGKKHIRCWNKVESLKHQDRVLCQARALWQTLQPLHLPTHVIDLIASLAGLNKEGGRRAKPTTAITAADAAAAAAPTTKTAAITTKEEDHAPIEIQEDSYSSCTTAASTTNDENSNGREATLNTPHEVQPVGIVGT